VDSQREYWRTDLGADIAAARQGRERPAIPVLRPVPVPGQLLVGPWVQYRRTSSAASAVAALPAARFLARAHRARFSRHPGVEILHEARLECRARGLETARNRTQGRGSAGSASWS